MCDCIREIEQTALDHVTKSHAEKNETVLPLKRFDDEGVRNTSFAMLREKETMQITGTQLLTHFIYRYTFQKRDGSTSKPKVMNVSLHFTYCPFCGEPYTKPKSTVRVCDVYYLDMQKHELSSRISSDAEGILKEINSANKTEYTGVKYGNDLVCGTAENAIAWSTFMNSYINWE